MSRDRALIDALIALVEKHPRWGFWKYFRALRRAGHGWNHKRVYRVYCQLNLNQPRRTGRRLSRRERVPLVVPVQPNQIWSADFMADSLCCGKRFRTFNVIDDRNREAVAIKVDTSLTGPRLIRVFE